MQLEHAAAFRKLSELSQCSLLITVESLYRSFRLITSDVRLGELRKGAEEGLRVVLEVCGESMGNDDESLQNGDESLQNGDESLQNDDGSLQNGDESLQNGDESLQNDDGSLQNDDGSLQNGDESLQDIHNPNESSPSSHQLTSSHSLAEPVHSIQAYLEKLPPEDIATDPILSSLVASLPTLLRFLKTPSVSFIVLCYE